MYPPLKELLKKFLFDIAPVDKNLSVQDFCKNRPHPFVPVIHAGRCETESYELSRIIAENIKRIGLLGRPPFWRNKGLKAVSNFSQSILSANL